MDPFLQKQHYKAAETKVRTEDATAQKDRKLKTDFVEAFTKLTEAVETGLISLTHFVLNAGNMTNSVNLLNKTLFVVKHFSSTFASRNKNIFPNRPSKNSSWQITTGKNN